MRAWMCAGTRLCAPTCLCACWLGRCTPSPRQAGTRLCTPSLHQSRTRLCTHTYPYVYALSTPEHTHMPRAEQLHAISAQSRNTPEHTYLRAEHARLWAEQVHAIYVPSRNTPAHAISAPSMNTTANTHLPVRLRARTHAYGISRCTPSPRQAGTCLRTPTYYPCACALH